MNTKKQYFTGVITILLLVVLVTPTVSYATTYQPRTQAEMIAYLYGRISQLMEIQAALGQGGGGAVAKILPKTVTVTTYRAVEVTDKTAILRGEIILAEKNTARVWFEYGEDEDFLDRKTVQKTIRTIYDRGLRIILTNIEDDERYYFRIVALDNNGDVHYGETFAFRTKESD